MQMGLFLKSGFSAWGEKEEMSYSLGSRSVTRGNTGCMDVYAGTGKRQEPWLISAVLRLPFPGRLPGRA